MENVKKVNQHGASPLPKGKRKAGVPMFKKPKLQEGESKKRDVTGQTDKSLGDMKKRLAEIPKKSAGSKHDKAAFEKGR